MPPKRFDGEGRWVMQGQCGECGAHWVSGPTSPFPDEPRRLREVKRKPYCNAVGCSGWPLTWVWIYYPTKQARELTWGR